MLRRKTTRERYGKHTPVGVSAKRDRKLITFSNWAPTDRQQRFLLAYAERAVVASAARRAGVARASVYRWLASIPGFEKAVRDAYQRSTVAAKRRWEAWSEERRRRRKEREKGRHAMRCANLAKARAVLKEARRRRAGLRQQA